MNSNIFFQPFVGKDYANGGIFGKRLWNNLPNVGWQDGDDIVVDGYPVATGAYLLSNFRQVKVMAVNHPSVGYSWDYWHKVILRFLRNS